MYVLGMEDIMKFNIYDKKNQRVLIVIIAAILALAMVAGFISYLIY